MLVVCLSFLTQFKNALRVHFLQRVSLSQHYLRIPSVVHGHDPDAGSFRQRDLVFLQLRCHDGCLLYAAGLQAGDSLFPYAAFSGW